MLVPVIGLVQVGSQAMADRYTYLPQIGLGIMAAWPLARLASFRPLGRVAAVAASVCAIAVLMVCAWQQTTELKAVAGIERLSTIFSALLSVAVRLHLVEFMWNGQIKKNGAWERRFDAPYGPAFHRI